MIMSPLHIVNNLLSVVIVCHFSIFVICAAQNENYEKVVARLSKFDCGSTPEDNLPDPDNPCNKYFITCASGQVYVKECPGDLRFDVLSNQCLQWQFVTACNGTATTMTTTITTVTPAIDCIVLGDGRYEDPSAGCGRGFIACLAGVVFRFKCQINTTFDKRTDRCQSVDTIERCGGTTIHTTVSTESTITTTTTKQNITCEGKEVGNFADPSSECSGRFYICMGTPFAIAQQCASGTYYEPSLQQCLFYNQVPGCTGITTLKPVAFDCTGLPLGNYPNPKSDCSRIFYSCTELSTLERKCAASDTSVTYYDKSVNSCLMFEDVPECTGLPRDSTTQTPTTPLPLNCTYLNDGNYPIPGEKCLNYFIQCSNSRSFRANCSTPFLRYNAIDDACLPPSEVPGC